MNLTTPTYDELKRQERICMDAIVIHRQLLESHQEQLRDIRARVEQVKKQEKKNQV
jgi:hypothetical protein